MKNCYINIFTFDLVWKGLIDNPISLTHKSSWHEIVNSTLVVSKDAANVAELQIGRVLVVNNQKDKALIIENITRNLNEPTLTIDCIPLKGILNWRICHPTDYAGNTARKQSEIMMIIPFNNLVAQTRDNDRKFWSSAGAAGGKNMFGVVGLKVYGETIDYTIDWKTGYMGDAIVNIAKMNIAGGYPVGWNIYITDDWLYFNMDTYQATNRSTNQTALPAVVFSEEFGNIKNATWTNSNKDWRNVVYVTWNNGSADQNTPVGDASRGATIGFNRKEIIIDSSKKTSNEVVAEGRSELNKRPIIESFTADIIDTGSTLSTYGVDWKLGDIVTIQSKLLNVSVNAQVTEIEEVYSNGEYSLSATFNEGQMNLVKLIKSEIKRS